MRKQDIEVNVSVKGVSEEGFKKIEDSFDFLTAEYGNGRMHLEFEGVYFFIDELLEMITEFTESALDGVVDYIDREAWTMTRYRWQSGRLEVKEINLNDVLERYSRE